MSSEIGDIRIDHGRIYTPFVNKHIWSVDNFSVRSDVGKADKLDTSLQQSSTNEVNTESSQIEEESLKISSLKPLRSRNRVNG